jgi:8-oxo-dGTP pyrophosphatase MutT (NUDIX family)
MRTRDEVLLVIYRPGPSFLVLLRSPESNGYWHLVAGGIEEGEAPDAAALRELSEETALTHPVRFAPIALELGYRSLDDDMWVTLHPYSVEVAAEWEPVLNEEHVEYRWCSELQAEELLEYPEPRDALRQVVRQLEVGT